MTEIIIHASELIHAYKALCCRFGGDHRQTAAAAKALLDASREEADKAFWHYIAHRALSRANTPAYKPCAGCPGRK